MRDFDPSRSDVLGNVTPVLKREPDVFTRVSRTLKCVSRRPWIKDQQDGHQRGNFEQLHLPAFVINDATHALRSPPSKDIAAAKT